MANLDFINSIPCTWCGCKESEHTKEATVLNHIGKLCPVPGVTSQFYTPKFVVIDKILFDGFIESLKQCAHKLKSEYEDITGKVK